VANIFVYIELQQNAATSASLSALNVGRVVASSLGATLYALLPCAAPPSYGTDDIITVLARHGADKVVLVTHPSLADPALYVTHGKAVLAACEQFRPRLILFAASSAGQDLAPRLAAVLSAEYGPLTHLEVDGGEPRFVSAAFRRHFVCSLTPRSQTLVVTLSRGQPPRTVGDDEAEVVVMHGSMPDLPALQILGRRSAPRSDLASARLVVGGGSGLGNKETFDLARRLAALLGGAPAGSSSACARGLVERELQVGVDGSALASDLYLAFGVSGSDRHLAGVAPDTTIVAINNDPQAPLLAVAEYSLVADAAQALRELIDELESGGAS
jgi:electron transfer flavoprotein alpha subunit